MAWELSPQQVFNASPIVPVMVIKDLDDAVPMAQALLDGGIKIFEITLRTECALDAIRLISESFPDVLVGAGTVLDTKQYDAAIEAGAKFIISPGFTPELLDYATKQTVPLIPGVSTASEVMQARSYGYKHLKFFPAEANGGAPALKSISGPITDVQFCPTGGISPKNIGDYLAIGSVATAGGSWMLPESLLAAKDWSAITQLTKEAVELVEGLTK